MIIGLNIKSMQANIDRNKIKGNINIKSMPKIEKIEKRENPKHGMEDVVFIDFGFQTIYYPDVGNIRINGEVLYKDNSNQILEQSKAHKKLDDKIAVLVLNTILPSLAPASSFFVTLTA